MDRSVAGTRNLRCLNCGADTVFRIWEIVDIDERPDLYKKIVTGTLLDAYCPNCKEFMLKVDSPCWFTVLTRNRTTFILQRKNP